MGPREMLETLVALAGKLGVEVRFESFDAAAIAGRGGLCRVHGRDVVVVDERLAVIDRLEIVASALSTFDTEHVYVPPEVRRKLERRREPRTAGPSLRKARTRTGT